MLERLQGAGYKLTTPRRLVLAALHAAGEPLTAPAVAERAGTSLASTYRVLGLLAELGLVSEVEEEGGDAEAPQPDARSRRYALCSLSEHHHHFVCRSCHATLDLASDGLERALEELAGRAGVRLEGHEITLRGQCARCATSGDGL
ncbi:MAG TPA: Fur family transcriptional regulator [Ktedonobacterales bacterium]|jgi:Fur family ferric uptake transcriptional regulator|nr:Fur family transcriptional regulator [Ktedonobacterales bacterium]